MIKPLINHNTSIEIIAMHRHKSVHRCGIVSKKRRVFDKGRQYDDTTLSEF